MAESCFAAYQAERYQHGATGQPSPVPWRYAELEARARQVLEAGPYWYVAGGAGEETLAANREAFRRYRLVPRVLRDVSTCQLSVRLFNTDLPAPLLLAPIGLQGIVHPDGLALGARAVLLGRPYIWGLALAGEAGVREILRRLLAEVELTLGLAGYNQVSQLGPDALSHTGAPAR